MRTRRLLLLTVLVVVSLTGLAPAKSACAQQPGDIITFVVPSGLGFILPSDVLVYIQQPAGFMDAVNCAADPTPRPVQNGIVVDSGAGQGGRPFHTTVITISVNGVAQTTAVHNGTRVGDPALDCGVSPCCTINGVPYDTYKGTVL